MKQASVDFAALFHVEGPPLTDSESAAEISLPSPLLAWADDWEPTIYREPVEFEALCPSILAIAPIHIGVELDESEANARPMAIMPSMAALARMR